MSWKNVPLRGLLIAAVLALAALTAPAAAQCVSSGEARRAVGSGAAVPLSVALQRAGVSGQVVNVALCFNGRNAVYQVKVLDGQGNLRQLAIPAN